jgi:hypothetical protein
MDAHSREKKMSLRDRAQRKSFASETLYCNRKLYFLLQKKRSAMEIAVTNVKKAQKEK